MIVVMGVSGAGKTTVGRALAAHLGWEFHDADAFHTAENIAKMHAGHGLTDDERKPWLDELHALVMRVESSGQRAVLACSALKAVYRNAIVRGSAPGAVRFVYLEVPTPVLHERLRERADHFAPSALLDSQLADLEVPAHAVCVDGNQPVDDIVARVRDELFS